MPATITQSVIVLGAGASRGARVKSRKVPPTDLDFLKKSAELCLHKRKKGPNAALSKAWKSFKNSLTKARIPFAEVKSWRLEQLATFLEARANMNGLQEAPSWIFWGYSFPQTDTNGHVLFRTALENHKKAKPVYVINPDMAVKAQVESICRGKVKVLQFPSMESFLLELGVLGEKINVSKKRGRRKTVAPRNSARTARRRKTS